MAALRAFVRWLSPGFAELCAKTQGVCLSLFAIKENTWCFYTTLASRHVFRTCLNHQPGRSGLPHTANGTFSDADVQRLIITVQINEAADLT